MDINATDIFGEVGRVASSNDYVSEEVVTSTPPDIHSPFCTEINQMLPKGFDGITAQQENTDFNNFSVGATNRLNVNTSDADISQSDYEIHQVGQEFLVSLSHSDDGADAGLNSADELTHAAMESVRLSLQLGQELQTRPSPVDTAHVEVLTCGLSELSASTSQLHQELPAESSNQIGAVISQSQSGNFVGVLKHDGIPFATETTPSVTNVEVQQITEAGYIIEENLVEEYCHVERDKDSGAVSFHHDLDTAIDRPPDTEANADVKTMSAALMKQISKEQTSENTGTMGENQQKTDNDFIIQENIDEDCYDVVTDDVAAAIGDDQEATVVRPQQPSVAAVKCEKLFGDTTSVDEVQDARPQKPSVSSAECEQLNDEATSVGKVQDAAVVRPQHPSMAAMKCEKLYGEARSVGEVKDARPQQPAVECERLYGVDYDRAMAEFMRQHELDVDDQEELVETTRNEAEVSTKVKITHELGAFDILQQASLDCGLITREINTDEPVTNTIFKSRRKRKHPLREGASMPRTGTSKATPNMALRVPMTFPLKIPQFKKQKLDQKVDDTSVKMVNTGVTGNTEITGVYRENENTGVSKEAENTAVTIKTSVANDTQSENTGVTKTTDVSNDSQAKNAEHTGVTKAVENTDVQHQTKNTGYNQQKVNKNTSVSDKKVVEKTSGSKDSANLMTDKKTLISMATNVKKDLHRNTIKDQENTSVSPNTSDSQNTENTHNDNANGRKNKYLPYKVPEDFSAEKEREMSADYICGKCGNEGKINGCSCKKPGILGTRLFRYKCIEHCGREFFNRRDYDNHERMLLNVRPFSCTLCVKTFTSKILLGKHIQVHIGEKPFECEECHKRFMYKRDLVMHGKIHTGEKTFICEHCGNAYTNEKNLLIHKLSHTKEEPFRCRKCDKLFLSKNTRDIHEESHTSDGPFPCCFCGKLFNCRSNLSRHKRRLHKTVNPDYYACYSCGDKFQDGEAMMEHVKKHYNEPSVKCEKCGRECATKVELAGHKCADYSSKPFKCAECDKAFISEFNLQKHLVMAHTNEMAFICMICQERFLTRELLAVHSKSEHKENGKKIYKCNICGKILSCGPNLRRHRRSHNLNESPYICSECGAIFPSSDRLKNHKVLHGDERPYECQICEKTFKTKTNLRQHRRIHSDTKPHVCTVCNKTFRSNSHLVSHARVHTDDYPFKCSECDKTFISESYFNQHMNKKHSEVIYENETATEKEATGSRSRPRRHRLVPTHPVAVYNTALANILVAQQQFVAAQQQLVAHVAQSSVPTPSTSKRKTKPRKCKRKSQNDVYPVLMTSANDFDQNASANEDEDRSGDLGENNTSESQADDFTVVVKNEAD